MSTESLFQAALELLREPDPRLKCDGSQKVLSMWLNDGFVLDDDSSVVSIPDVGRPDKPLLISPKNLKQRSIHTDKGRLVLMHAIAHIEFNAINLAWDAVYRFREMPKAYYGDWIQVASDEARHFELICQYLKSHGVNYGDYPAHNGLWDMALKTEHDVMVRMALVPRVMEARGLDVTPRMIESLQRLGDEQAVSILQLIYEEEITHVEIGNRWFQYCCENRQLDARATFKALVGEYFHGGLRGPYNLEARLQAGFDQEELEALFDSKH